MKRIIIATLLLSLCQSIWSQERSEFIINGIAPKDVNTIYMSDAASMIPTDSVKVKDGKFQLKGSFNGSDVFGYVFKGDPDDPSKQNGLIFLCDGTPISVDMDKMLLKGSEQNEKLNLYLRQIQDTMKVEINIYSKIFHKALADSLGEDSLSKIRSQVNDLSFRLPNTCKFVKNIIKDNADNLIPAVLINKIYYRMTKDDLGELIESKAHWTKNFMACSAVSRYGKLLMLGNMFIDHELEALDGSIHKLSEYCGKGNYVLLNFWASWCGPCRGEMPFLKTCYEKYHDKGFEIIGISLDNRVADWKKAIEELDIRWVHLRDVGGFVSNLYTVSGVPAVFLLDPEGKIVNISDMDFTNILKEKYGF